MPSPSTITFSTDSEFAVAAIPTAIWREFVTEAFSNRISCSEAMAQALKSWIAGSKADKTKKGKEKNVRTDNRGTKGI